MDKNFAFPAETDEVDHYGGHSHQYVKKHPGLTKREWFAGMALQGMLAMPSFAKRTKEEWLDFLTKRAFEYADEMIKISGK